MTQHNHEEAVPPVIDAPSNQPPSDALVLFDGNSLSEWETITGAPASWRRDGDAMTVVPGTGDIRTRRSFADIQLHLEWRAPAEIYDRKGQPLCGQARGNSGVFLQNRYEIQVLDSYDNHTYPSGQAGAIYNQHKPQVNASRQPGSWQCFDIIYTAPRFRGDQLIQSARVTVLHNGVLIHNHVAIRGGTERADNPTYEAHGPLPLRLQDHGDPVSFRNIWLREI